MADYALTPCPCGGDALTVDLSAHRAEAREVMAQHFQELAAAETLDIAGQRDVTRTQLALQILQAEQSEVSCGNCGRWVHDDSADHAANLWNRAIAKLDALQACCDHDYERRVDYDGMVIHRCTGEAHDDTINGRRYLPLEPDENYEVKPSQAGGRRG